MGKRPRSSARPQGSVRRSSACTDLILEALRRHSLAVSGSQNVMDVDAVLFFANVAAKGAVAEVDLGRVARLDVLDE